MIGVVIAEVEQQRSIVERAIAGDEVAFARIVAAHHDDMARIAYFVCGELDIAEEAEQSAWGIAFHRLKDTRDLAPSQPVQFQRLVAEVMPILEGFEFH